MRKPHFSEQLPERFPEFMGTHMKDFHLPMHSRSVFFVEKHFGGPRAPDLKRGEKHSKTKEILTKEKKKGKPQNKERKDREETWKRAMKNTPQQRSFNPSRTPEILGKERKNTQKARKSWQESQRKGKPPPPKKGVEGEGRTNPSAPEAH